MQNRDVMVARLTQKIYKKTHEDVLGIDELQIYLYLAELESRVITGNGIIKENIEYWGKIFLIPVLPDILEWHENGADNNEAIQVSFDTYYIIKKIIDELRNCTQLQLRIKMSEQLAYQKARRRAEFSQIEAFFGENDKIHVENEKPKIRAILMTQDIKEAAMGILKICDIKEDAKEIRKKRGMIWYKENEQYLFLKEQVKKEYGADIITIGKDDKIVDEIMKKYTGKEFINGCTI